MRAASFAALPTRHRCGVGGAGIATEWKVRLFKVGEPFTTFVDAQCTPVP